MKPVVVTMNGDWSFKRTQKHHKSIIKEVHMTIFQFFWSHVTTLCEKTLKFKSFFTENQTQWAVLEGNSPLEGRLSENNVLNCSLFFTQSYSMTLNPTHKSYEPLYHTLLVHSHHFWSLKAQVTIHCNGMEKRDQRILWNCLLPVLRQEVIWVWNGSRWVNCIFI